MHGLVRVGDDLSTDHLRLTSGLHARLDGEPAHGAPRLGEAARAQPRAAAREPQAATALIFALLLDGLEGITNFWSRTVGYQAGRESPFSIWGQYPGLSWVHWALAVVVVAPVSLAMLPVFELATTLLQPITQRQMRWSVAASESTAVMTSFKYKCRLLYHCLGDEL